MTPITQADRVEGERRDDLLDEAIATFREMLVERTDLIRVGLELARAFFLKGEVQPGGVAGARAAPHRRAALRLRADRRRAAVRAAVLKGRPS